VKEEKQNDNAFRLTLGADAVVLFRMVIFRSTLVACQNKPPMGYKGPSYMTKPNRRAAGGVYSRFGISSAQRRQREKNVSQIRKRI